jgi:hypothetical protein
MPSSPSCRKLVGPLGSGSAGRQFAVGSIMGIKQLVVLACSLLHWVPIPQRKIVIILGREDRQKWSDQKWLKRIVDEISPLWKFMGVVYPNCDDPGVGCSICALKVWLRSSSTLVVLSDQAHKKISKFKPWSHSWNT